MSLAQRGGYVVSFSAQRDRRGHSEGGKEKYGRGIKYEAKPNEDSELSKVGTEIGMFLATMIIAGFLLIELIRSIL